MKGGVTPDTPVLTFAIRRRVESHYPRLSEISGNAGKAAFPAHFTNQKTDETQHNPFC